MIQPVRPGFESRTEFDLIEVVRWLSDPSILPIERLRDISGFVGNILSEFEASFPMQDRRRLRWDRCCVELRQLGANSYQSALRGEACNKVLHRTLGGFEQVEGRMRRLIYQLRLPPSTSQGGVVRGCPRGGYQWAAEARAAWWSGGVWGSADWRRRASKERASGPPLRGEPGCWLKDREPEKPRSRNCHEPRLSRQGVFIHGRKELR